MLYSMTLMVPCCVHSACHLNGVWVISYTTLCTDANRVVVPFQPYWVSSAECNQEQTVYTHDWFQCMQVVPAT